jgi:hypothetical protein
VPEHEDHRDTQFEDRELDARADRGIQHGSGATNHEEITESLVEQELDGYAGIGAPDDSGEG